jgi:hypothetical protein
MMQFTKKLELGELATFVPNKILPVYNWLYYKEGFSRDFVFTMLKEFNIKKGKKLFIC